MTTPTPTVWTWSEFTTEYPEVVLRVVSPFSQAWGEIQLAEAEAEHAIDYWGTSRRKGIGLYAAHLITTKTAQAGVGNVAGAGGQGVSPSGAPLISERVGDLSRSYANPYNNALLSRGAIGASDPDMLATTYGQRWLALRASLNQGFLVTL